MKLELSRRAAAEFLGTAFLLAIVVGSGIMGERLAGGNEAVTLLANTLATGAGLVALILAFGGLSGAHFNPVVSLLQSFGRELPWSELAVYVLAQVAGAFVGVATAHVMFGLPLFFASERARSSPGELLGEVVATFGLLVTIGCVARKRPESIPVAVGAYITAAYWFTSSTSFANPAVTLARAATNTFAGIRPADAPGFVLAELAGASLATAFLRWLIRRSPVVGG